MTNWVGSIKESFLRFMLLLLLLLDDIICGNKEEQGIVLTEKRMNSVFGHAGF